MAIDKATLRELLTVFCALRISEIAKTPQTRYMFGSLGPRTSQPGSSAASGEERRERQTCDEENRYICPEDFNCNDDGFLCTSGEAFSCPGLYLCMSQFDCGEEEGGEYECKGQIFECDDGAGGPPGYEGFTCNKGAVIQFDCDASGSKEFNCGPFPEGSGTFECIPDEADSFECSVEDIFNCLDFTCGESHICDVGTNGTGDFICWQFACGSGAQGDPPIENFDCKAHDKFGCLDSWEGARFDCGANSTFECGDEGEKYECLNFTCGSPFSCSSGFTCGNRINGNVYTYDCNDFICLAIVVPEPNGWFDCGGGAEDPFHCRDAAFGCSGGFNPP